MPNLNLSVGSSGSAVANLHKTLAKNGINVPAAEVSGQKFGPGTAQAVQQYQSKQGLPVTGAVDAATAAALAGITTASGAVVAGGVPGVGVAAGGGGAVAGGVAGGVGAGGGAAGGGGTPGRGGAGGGRGGASNTVDGHVFFDTGLPAAGLILRAYSRGFAGADTKLGETKTDAQGVYSITYAPGNSAINLEIRAVDSQGKELAISSIKYSAGTQETLNLIAPSSLQPLAPEYQRLAADMDKQIGGIAKLGQAQEGADRQDLTMINQSTNWDARLVALAGTAAQQTTTTGLGQDALYALYRVGLPSDPTHLAMVPSGTVQAALKKANDAGIVSMNADQIATATTAFQTFATKTRLSLTTPGGVSNYSTLLAATVPDATQQATFTNLYFSNPSAGADLWKQAANLKIPAQTLDALKLQGKFLHLTFNNSALAQKLQQDIGSLANLSQLADKDYHQPATWSAALTALAGAGGDKALQGLIPAIYAGDKTSDRLLAYSADMARKVRFSFPTQVTARMIEAKQLAVDDASGPKVTAFLRAAAPLGFKLGQTPLNTFLKNSAKDLPALDAASTESLKTVHRLYQITPSNESLQVAMKLGFKSARDVVAYKRDEFMSKYSGYFPSQGEAHMIYGKAQQVSSVTFNFYMMAKQMDTSPPLFALSASSDDLQNARKAIVEQFPTMTGLFGSLDFCQCEDCRSVLSPAAYFVDLLEFLNKSGANSKGYTPLDVLIGKDINFKGRRPDLAALPLTCENTNTAMPYIDLVNEILEYYIAHNSLDAGVAYDTGSETTADLTAEPQHVLASVYDTNLKQAVYPLNLPFDLWIETVRAFFSYFKNPLTQVLDVLRPADNLELFTDANLYPYYRAQILAESLGLSPSEYLILTVTDPVSQKPSVQNWFQLYGYATEPAALSDLKSAKTLSKKLGLTYQELTDLVTTGFLNPALNALIFQFRRFGIEMSDAFSYTGQAGYADWTQPQYQQDKKDFEALLDGITAKYKNQNLSSTFNARTWLANLLPAGYSKKILVLLDPDTGCNFTSTTLQYADGTAASTLDFLKFNLFVRLWKKLGWTLDETDRALQAFFPTNLPAWTDPNFASTFSNAWKTALVYLAHLDDLNTRLAPPLGRRALLPLWADLPAQGENALYAQLFLTPAVLNNDWAFDDPNGQFPTPAGDLSNPLKVFSAHLPTVQGALGLTSDEVTAILSDASIAPATAGFTLANLSICYRYSILAKCLQLSVSDMIVLKAMSGLNPFMSLTGNSLAALSDDVLFNQTLAFVKQVAVVMDSGFTVEDLKYLLRHQFDPVGIYQSDPNALIALMQTVANGLRQIQSENAVPASLATMPDAQIDQQLSGLFPAKILKTLFAQLTNSQTYTASQVGVATAIDPTPFAQETELTLSYDSVTHTQTLSCTGLLTDWKKNQLLQINSSALFSSLLAGVQEQALQALNQSIGNIVGVWASLAEYEAVQTGVAVGLAGQLLTQKDSAVSLSYDQAGQLQWLGYRGVLTDTKMAALTSLNNSPVLLALLKDVQNQAIAPYKELVGAILAMWVNVQTYSVTQNAVASPIDVNGFFAALALAEQKGTITGPVPAIQFSYDSAAQVQGLTFGGVLTDVMRGQLAGLLPASTVLANLLKDARNQAVQLFQTLTTNLFTVTATDLDNYSQAFLGLDATHQQKQVKAELVKVFLPLLTQKLSRDLIVQTLAANLGSDKSLTGNLIDDAGLLADPGNPGKSLLGSFLAVGQQGVSATYFASANPGGAALATGIAATTDTEAPAKPNGITAGMGSAHYEGFLEVPTDGPYRFFAELGNTGAAARFQLTSPDPTGLLSNPIIPSLPAAAKDHDEVSQFVELKGGVPYQFSLDFSNLGTNGASLVIQGENLPKGPLSQVILYPQAAVVAFTRARVLLSKVLQILQVTGLDEREVSYLAANAARFNNLNFSALPTQASDDSLANAIALFSQFLTLADYADLRRGPAGKSDGLVDVFQAAVNNVTQEPNTPWTLLANLTRRNSQVVKDVASALGPISLFMDNAGIRRIWSALQLAQVMGIPVSALTASSLIASLSPPASAQGIATSLKNAVKARFTPDTWRAIAKSIFDKLRQRKRDSLVAYLLNALPAEDENQLFEYFLVDPGMEPVVQTSRLRLAMSSVQTFIQRCLLNLENANDLNPERNVAPNAIDADWWEWMKRYRVWQANREIFLFPENWMIPELRMDKTDLFQALESALLQGDVTSDLVDDAFLTYLKGLELRARLDIVATYLDQDPTHLDISTLYVLGRTYGHPHKYFFRTYSNGTWSGWEVVTPDIEGNHIVLAIWRGRLNIFWATFINQAQPPSAPASGGSNDPAASSLGFSNLANQIFNNTALPQVKVQLHWSDYFQGKWSKRISTDVNHYQAITVPQPFDPNNVPIHVSKEFDSNGNEGAVKIHMDFAYPDGGVSFRVTSKNCDPGFDDQYWETAPEMVYDAPGFDATLFTGTGNLTATFQSGISGGAGTANTENILDTVNDFALLICANTVAPPFLKPSEPSYWEAGALVSPFFFKDTTNPNASSQSNFFDELTFFVQPSLTEQTMEEWEGWAIAPSMPVQDWADPNLVNKIDLVSQYPAAVSVPINPGDPVYSKYSLQPREDWSTNPATAISFGNILVGKTGQLDLKKMSIMSGGVRVSGPGRTGSAASTPAGGVATRGGLMYVGGRGLQLSQLQSLKALQGSAGASNAIALSKQRNF
ncbi:MAG: neuraminidase-like domain-containing protein [Terriglobia bacterium]